MMGTVETRGARMHVQVGDVAMYYEDDGDGDPLVLLHPGLADSRAWEANVPGLSRRFRVLRPDQRGHGRTADVAGPITLDLLVADTVAFLEQVAGGPAPVVGHSTGGFLALAVALRRPDLVPRLVVSASVFHHDAWAPGVLDLDEETTAFFAEYHGAVSPDAPEHFPEFAAKMDRMHRSEPAFTAADLAAYPHPALVMVGDADTEIPIEHTLAMRDGLPDAQLAVVPGADHGGPAEKTAVYDHLLLDFLTG